MYRSSGTSVPVFPTPLFSTGSTTMRNLRDQKGFSLIELMIVVVIIGILAAIAIPRFSNIADRARQGEADPILRQIHNMQEMHFADFGTYAGAAGLTAAADPGVAGNLAQYGWDPLNVATDWFTYEITAGGATFTANAIADPAWDAGVDRTIDETGRITDL
jgi:prepilin-type N-terminal cleavage/methylation domain-containing protein